MARRLRLAQGFSVLADAGVVWLVGGEDLRFRIGAGPWLAELLRACDGTSTVDQLVERAPPADRGDVAPLLEHLASERVLVDGTATQAHERSAQVDIVGDGELARRLRSGSSHRAPADDSLVAFVQDRMDHGAVLAFNATALATRRRWMWITTGPAQRAYIGPLFVPDAGPCAACLLLHFKRLSPVPELHDLAIANGAAMSPADVPEPMLDAAAAIARWKLSLASEPVARPALYALHVVELADLTVSSHVPIADAECSACQT